MQATVGEIAAWVDGRVVGDSNLVIRGIGGIREAGPDDLTFLADPRYIRYLEGSRAAAVLVRPEITKAAKALIQVSDPYLAFARVLQRYPPLEVRHPRGIHPTAVVNPNVTLGQGVALDAHCYVGEGSELGDGVIVYPGVYIGPNSTIGPHTIIYPNVTIRDHTIIGARCILHAGAAVGSDGFGFVTVDGKHEKVPQMGIVVIEDDVEIGSNTAIDRATVGKTVIGCGTKIDNLVQVGHNVEIGHDCIVCGKAGISGSARIGNQVTLAADAGVAGHIQIGDNVVVAGMSGVTKSIPPGRRVSGFPAIDHEVEKRLKASLRSLPKALRTLRELEKRIEQLESLLHGKTTDHR